LIISSWNLKIYKNKNFEEFLDETVIFISELTIDRGPTILEKIIEPFTDY
jgi:hypothetical protein